MNRFITMATAATIMFFAPGIRQAYAAEKGEKSVGLKGGYTTVNHSAAAGLYFQYSFSDHFRLAPDVDYVFRHDRSDALAINLNAQFPIAIASERFSIYPFAGLSYGIWSHHNRADSEGSTGGTSRVKRFGLNGGAGVEMRVTPTLKLMAEARYSWIRHYDGGFFGVGIGYIF